MSIAKTETTFPWEDRFWEKVDMRGPDECWEWMATKIHGYGYLRINGRVLRAHRLAWKLENGPIPEGLCVLHRCDHPCCQNPSHLFLGTQADNNRDMVAKGRARGPRGEQNGNAALTREKVREIRRLRATGKHTLKALGERFGVTPAQISYIARRKSWAWLE